MKDQDRPNVAQDGFGSASMDRRTVLRATGGVVAVMGAGGLLAACGSDGESDGQSQKGGTLRFGSSQPTLDPAMFPQGNQGWEMDGLFEPLFTYKVGEGRETVNVLAKSVTVSSDGRRIEFVLKEGIPFQKNFGELTAEDVKYSLERVAGIQDLYPDAKDGEVSPFEAELASLERVDVTGKYTGALVLRHPDTSIMTSILPFESVGLIVSKKAVEEYGSDFAKNPVGTGPYELSSSFDPDGKGSTFSRVKDWKAYWDRPTSWAEISYASGTFGETKPGVSATVPVEAGEIDVVYATPQDYERINASSGGRAKAWLSPSLSYAALVANANNEALKDVRIRQAIRLAISIPDQLKLARLDDSFRANAIISDAFPIGYWQDAPEYQVNIEQAKALLEDAGATSLNLEFYDSGFTEGTSELIQANLKAIGIETTILKTRPGSWTEDPTAAQLLTFSYGGGPNPPYQFIWWSCGQVGIYNLAQWCDRKYSALLEQLTRTLDETKQQEISVKMQEIMDDSAVFTWLYYQPYYYVTAPDVEPAYDVSGQPMPTWFAQT